MNADVHLSARAQINHSWHHHAAALVIAAAMTTWIRLHVGIRSGRMQTLGIGVTDINTQYYVWYLIGIVKYYTGHCQVLFHYFTADTTSAILLCHAVQTREAVSTGICCFIQSRSQLYALRQVRTLCVNDHT